MRYSNYLRRYRKLNNLKQKQVGKLMGLKDSSLISRWENGFSLPDLENAFKLAAVYGVKVDDLFVALKHPVRKKGCTPQSTTHKYFLISLDRRET